VTSLRGWLLLAALCVLSGCGDDTPPPTAPTPAPLPFSIEISVSPNPLRLSLGQTQQLRAVVTLSDGSARDVSSQATWSVVDSRVATIDARGMATAHGYGTTSFFARFEERATIALRLEVPVPPELRAPLTGVVHDQHGAPVPGALLTPIGGDVSTRSATTDDNGFFDLGTAYGEARLRVARFGHLDAVAAVPADRLSRPLDVTLVADPWPFVERRIEGELRGASNGAPVTQTYRIVTRPGATVDFQVQVTSPCSSDEGRIGVRLQSGSFSAVGTESLGCRYRVRGVVPESECLLSITSSTPDRYVLAFREPG
jgi:hypothetical protein